MSNIQGLIQFREKLQRIQEKSGRKGKTLFQIASQIKNEAVRRAPKDSGALRKSGKVDEPEVIGNQTSVIIRFGGETAPYAVYVHEDLYAAHTNGEAKFLENACLAAEKEIGDFIAHEIEQDWRML
jgi:hypothetical protein